MFQAMQNPLGWCWLVLVVCSVAGLRDPARRWRSGLGITLVCVILSAFGGTPLSAWLLAGLERPFVSELPLRTKRVDAVVVLGGIAAGSTMEPTGFEATSGFDRVTAGLELVDRGWSTNLVLGGGVDGVGGRAVHAGEALRPWLERRVKAGARVWVLPVSRTTRDEAVHCAAMSAREGWRRIALVTSAWHLPRATSAFRAEGMDVEPVGCDFEGLPRLEARHRWTVIPGTGDLRLAGMWIHEVAGRVWYRVRGWGG